MIKNISECNYFTEWK